MAIAPQRMGEPNVNSSKIYEIGEGGLMNSPESLKDW
jgi:hypothetical protein